MKIIHYRHQLGRFAHIIRVIIRIIMLILKNNYNTEIYFGIKINKLSAKICYYIYIDDMSLRDRSL